MAKIIDGKEDIEPQFEEEEPDAETVFEDEGEGAADPDEALPDEVKKLSKSDLYAKVKALEEKAAPPPDPTERIAGAVEKAFSGLRSPVPQPQQQAGESDAEFMARLKKDLFDEEKAPALLNELIDRRMGPRFQQALELNFAQAQKLLELDPETGPVLKKYKTEIDALLSTLPANVQKTPQALDYALKQVKGAHIGDIAREMALAMLEEEKKKDAKTRREPLSLEAGGGAGGAGASPAPRKIILTRTQEDYRIADEMGVPVDAVVASRARRVSQKRS